MKISALAIKIDIDDNDQPFTVMLKVIMVAVSVLSQRYTVNPVRPGREQR